MRRFRLLVVGFGTVGQGLAELLVAKRDALAAGRGLDLSVVGVADTLKGSVHDPGGLDLEKLLAAAEAGERLDAVAEPFAGDAIELVAAADAEMMVEATYTDIETGEPATSHIRAALEAGMHVTTTNKGPIALHYHELAALAAERGVELLYEGTVMSGTPVLNLLRETLAGATVSEIKGILNGTTNYILTRMEEGLAYEDALAEAQARGYAEAVPDADVLGRDALAKVTILANAVFGADKRPADFACQGITGVTPEAIAGAASRGKRIKLIGRVWRDGDGVEAAVAVQELDVAHPLAGVRGATNALTITTDALGDVTIVGPGAGRRETGYSCLVDVLAAGTAR